MRRTIRLAAMVAVSATVIPQHGSAHAVAGARIFVNTNLIADPGVADEATLPQISLQSPDGTTWITDAHVEYDKTITPQLGFDVGTDWVSPAHDMADGGKSHAGFGDTFVQLKYNWITLPVHEFMSSVAVTQAFGRAGTVGIESGFNTTTLSGFFGKGLGDLPWAPEYCSVSPPDQVLMNPPAVGPISAEVLWPLNGAAGHNIGVIGMFHLFFDDLMPNTLGKPLVEW